MKTTHALKVAALLGLAFGSSGCLDWWPEFGIPAGKQPWGELNPLQEMHKSPASKDQGGDMRYLPPGTVPVGFRPNPIPADKQADAVALKNPVPINDESLKYGKLMYETSCIVCHGDDGRGMGYIVPKFPQPPDLTSARARDWADGQIYHVISYGQGTMGSYKSQLKPEERWAVVNYVRALQRAQYPEPTDLELTE